MNILMLILVLGVSIFLSSWTCEYLTKKRGFLLVPILLAVGILFFAYVVNTMQNMIPVAFMAGILFSFMLWLIARPLAYFLLLRKMRK